MNGTQLVGQLLQATAETFYLIGVSGLLAVVIGLPIGIVLETSAPGGLAPRPTLNRVLGVIVNVGRSLPFIILLVAILPFTRLVVGTTIGSTAVIVPLTVGAIPFFARLAEAALREVSRGKVEAALAMGASRIQVIRSVLVPESVSALIAAITTTVIALLGYSAMAGVVGGGGLGDLAYQYGYLAFRNDVTLAVVAVLVVLVTVIQVVGDRLARLFDHR